MIGVVAENLWKLLIIASVATPLIFKEKHS